jgi:hypothetical protein
MSAAMGTNARHTPQSVVITKAAKDVSGLRRAESYQSIEKTYFHNKVYGSAVPKEIFNIAQDEPVFIEKLHQTGQVPEVRATLNNVEYEYSTLDLIKSFEEATFLEEEEKEEMVREILMDNIVFIGTVKGDGFKSKPDGSSDITFDKFSVESAGTVQVKVRNQPLGIGMWAELKVPLRNEWEKSSEWKKTNGRLSLYVDPVKRRSALEKISYHFSKYNLFERKEFCKMIESMMSDASQDMPSNIKMVYSFTRLLKHASNLFRQKNISSGMFNVNTSLLTRNNAYPAFTADIEEIVPPLERGFVGYNIGLNPGFAEPVDLSLSSASVSIHRDSVQNSAYHPEKYNFLPALVDARTARPIIHGRHQHVSRFETSLDFFSVISQLSGIVSDKPRGHRGDVNIASERFVNQMSLQQREKYETLLNNGYMETYNTLIVDFLPQMKAPFFHFGFEMSGLDPVLNPHLYKKVEKPTMIVTDHGRPSSSRRRQQSTRQQDHYVINKNRDFGRTARAIARALPSYLHAIVNYSYDMNNGHRISVVDGADFGQAGTTYTRC